MLQNARRSAMDDQLDDGMTLSDAIDFDRLIAIAHRQWRLILIVIGAAIVTGIVYLVTAVPIYTATTDVLIDQSNNKLADQLAVLGVGGVEDEAAILTQVEVIQSEKIGMAVVDKLDLANDPAFMSSAGSLVSRFKDLVNAVINLPSWFVSTELTQDEIEARKRSALDRLQNGIEVKRVPKTYVLEINFSSPSPQLASKIARGLADAYLTDQLDSKYESTRRASDWLQNRIAELRQKALEADLAVQKFKTENGLIATGGQLVSDQQLQQLNSALITAQADTARTKARYEHIRSLVDSGQTDAIVAEALESPVISTLRTKYLDAAKRESDISARLGENHAQAIRLRSEMEEYKRLMFGELGRIADSYQSDYTVAMERENQLRDQVAMATGVSASGNETQVQLREMERESETYRNLYQTFLQRYQEAIQQQTFPVSDARVITGAAVPKYPSSPKKALVLALSAVLGGLLGIGVAGFREYRDRFFRIGEQVREELGLEFLGSVPLVSSSPLPTQLDDEPTDIQRRVIRKASTVTNYVIDHPLSAFAETMRSMKVAADFALGDRRPKIIGVVSSLPGEGKTTVSINFAELLASQGSRTLLVDADLRNPGLSRAMARHANAGLVEALLDGRPLRDLLMVNPTTKLAFLPLANRRSVPHSSELLVSPSMDVFLREAGESFDHIIVDLPPISPVVDARAFASRADAFIYVVEWGRTSRHAARASVQSEPQIFSKCLGVVLNKADQEKMKLYRSYGSAEYYAARYQTYYREE